MFIRELRATFATALILCLLCFGFWGCSQVQVSQDYDRGFNFQSVATFAWRDNALAQGDDILRDNDLLRKRFENAITANLQQNGFSQSSAPVYFVSCLYKIVTKFDNAPYDGAVSLGFGRYGRYGGFGIDSGTYVEGYDQGQLTVHIYSAQTGQLVWSGFATRQVRQHYTPQQYDALATEMTSAVMAQFPPHSGDTP